MEKQDSLFLLPMIFWCSSVFFLSSLVLCGKREYTSNEISDVFSVKIATDFLYKYCPVGREQDVNNRVTENLVLSYVWLPCFYLLDCIVLMREPNVSSSILYFLLYPSVAHLFPWASRLLRQAAFYNYDFYGDGFSLLTSLYTVPLGDLHCSSSLTARPHIHGCHQGRPPYSEWI